MVIGNYHLPITIYHQRSESIMQRNLYDTIIIGAGSVGTPLAWQLAEAGQKVLVLDQFASAGQGSNKEAIGGIQIGRAHV